MVSWWTGDDSWTDLVGSNDGSPQNGAIFAAGKVGKAFSLDGVDDRVDVADNPSFNPGNGGFTLDAWVFKTRVQSDIAVAPVVTKHLHDFGAGYALLAGSGGIGEPANNDIVWKALSGERVP